MSTYDDMGFEELQNTRWYPIVYLDECSLEDDGFTSACPYSGEIQHHCVQWDYGERDQEAESFYDVCSRLSYKEWTIQKHGGIHYLFVSQLGSISCYSEIDEMIEEAA